MTKGWRRTWIKIFVTGWLHGSIRWQLEADERGVWADLIALAGECGKDGALVDNDDRPYPRSFIAGQLNIPQELLDRTVAKCRHEGRIDNRDDAIVITNWKTYQSEYQRQKPYREGKKAGKKIHKKCPCCDYKALTNEDYCPKCLEKGKDTELETDYKAGKYGHMVWD